MSQATTPFSTLARAVAAGAQPPDLLPEMHREVLAATGGLRSVVLQQLPRSDGYRATSSHGIDSPAGLWLRGDEGRSLAAAARPGPAILDVPPALAARVGPGRALVVPIPAAKHPAILVVASPAAPDQHALEAGWHARVEFGVAIELARLAVEGAFHQQLRDISFAFSRNLTSKATSVTALESLSHEVNALLSARRTSVWLHDRRARELALTASSDPAHAAAAARVAVDDPRAPAALGLRLDFPQILAERTEPVLIAPLRGWRRALGTIVIDGSPASPLDDEQLAEVVDRLTRQVSVALENVHLLDEILRQRRLLEDTFNSLVDLVAVTDNTLRIVQANEAFAARTGIPRAQLRDRRLDEFVGTEVASWAGSAIFGHDVRTGQFRDETLGGTFAATIAPLINEEGGLAGRVLLARDVTGQVRLEAERAALGERLAQSEKLAALGQFVAGVAHEINNPLQGVLGHLELLIETSSEAKPVRATLRRIYQEADRAAKTVRNLLVFTGAHRLRRRRMNVERLVSRAISARSRTAARAGIEIVYEHEPGLPRLNADPLLLQQALLNLLINAEHAIGATGRGGRIVIHTSAPSAGGICISVSDTGPGIPPDVLPRMFDPFFTTKGVGQGTGLGLAITYGIIQEHGGTIRAENAAGGGAVMTIHLPALPIETGHA